MNYDRPRGYDETATEAACEATELNLENTLSGTCISLSNAHAILDQINAILDGPKPEPGGTKDPQHKPSVMDLAKNSNSGAGWLHERLIGLRDRLGNG